jgi:predicted outer membrane protein
MRSRHALPLLALVLAVTVAEGQGIPITKDGRAGAVPRPPVSGLVVYEMEEVQLPVFSLARYANMSDSGIVAHMIADDSLEITLANLAALKAVNARVRDYAALLANDHATHRDRSVLVADSVRIAPLPSPDDQEVSRMRAMLAWLDATPAGAAWDALFLRFQVTHHQNEIDVVNANVGRARTADLANHMRQSVTSLTKHRDIARSLSTLIGVTPK